MRSGWVRLHRQIEENDIYFSEPFSKGQAWIDIILNTNHADGTFYVRGNQVELKRGQLGWSEITMSERWKWSRNKVRRFLKLLEMKQQIEQQKTFITTIITVKNYDKYQQDETADDTAQKQQKDSKRYTNKNNKNINNIKNIDNILATEQVQSQVNEIMNIFYPINPTLNFGNKTQRNSIVDLIKAIGFEHVKFAAQYAVQIQGDQFAPTITTPLKLKNKLAELRNHFKKNNTNKSNSVTI